MCVVFVDFVQDSSDTELGSDDDKDLEYEPVTESEEEAPISADSSGQTDNEVRGGLVGAGGAGDSSSPDELQLADSEAGSYVSDSELDLPAYWTCARCHTANDNTRYRYCHKCFKTRKNFFPPRPRRKDKRLASNQEGSQTLSQDSGVESHFSQETKLSQDLDAESSVCRDNKICQQSEVGPSRGPERALGKDGKRRADSAERTFKKPRLESESDVEGKNDRVEVAPVVKTVSDPSITIESLEAYKGYKTDSKDMCIICLSEPKTGVFVHRRVAHICCCYKCSVKVWSKAKRCPICNCKVSNVLKAVVM
ncbi:unnamed protein product [Diatraea saccharalis]|uniref:Uncharacterized protein n=1 Tax=Diatraea saccharalis TaxID=40085 RepID=A0A9N9WEW3_9NEOP|nr:unnamed protein product [Diatraea saccharalis]